MEHPWTTGNIPGQRVAIVPTPEAAGKRIKEAKNPLLIVGALTMIKRPKGKLLLDYVIEIMEKRKLPVVATSESLRGFSERGISPIHMGLVEVVNRLQDPDWSTNSEPHDLIIFLGIHYYLASQGLSTLKHFAPHLKTMTLCGMYHPNAYWSFPNMRDEEWGKALEKVIENI
ncbi:MAG: CO dehydrogenase/acetyl-CoA synthase complex subunit epsilon [Candidatus Syntropharchaeia archaeon]